MIKPESILIIGGGVSGLVTLRNLLERGGFSNVQLVERRDDVGGVWYLDNADASPNKPRWPSPSYPGMVGNVLPEYLTVTQSPFPQPLNAPEQPFPSLEETHHYLHSLAAPFTNRIRLETEVTALKQIALHKWRATLREWGKPNAPTVEEEYDAVVFATAWFNYPAWPDTPGLSELRESGLASHSATWTGPGPYAGQRVAVIGNGNSANDICAALARTTPPVYRSARHPPIPNFACLPDPERIHDVTFVRTYTPTPNSTSARLTLRDDTTIDVDHVIVAIGYTPGFPIPISYLDEDGVNNLPETQPPQCPPLYRHVLYARDLSLAAVGCVMAFTPFTISDVASTWLSLVWSGRIEVPNEDARVAEVEKRMEVVEGKRKGGGDVSSFVALHVLGNGELGYARGLREDIVRAEPGMGKLLPEWTDGEWEARENMYKVKLRALEWEEEERRKKENRG